MTIDLSDYDKELIDLERAFFEYNSCKNVNDYILDYKSEYKNTQVWYDFLRAKIEYEKQKQIFVEKVLKKFTDKEIIKWEVVFNQRVAYVETI